MKEQEAEPSSPSAQNLGRLPTVFASVSQSAKWRQDCIRGMGEADDTNMTQSSKIGLDFVLGSWEEL